MRRSFTHRSPALFLVSLPVLLLPACGARTSLPGASQTEPSGTGGSGGAGGVGGVGGGLLNGELRVSLGQYHTCALRIPGAPHCWGHAADGQLGNGETYPSLTLPTPVVGLTDAVDLAAGDRHTCSLHPDGRVSCWGSNTSGEIARPHLSLVQSDVPLEVPGLSDVVQLSAGNHVTCARRAPGDVWCWGDNIYGQLGDAGLEESVSTPTPIPGVTDVVDLAVGSHHVCAVQRGGRVLCWGRNYDGQLGDGQSGVLSSPVTAVVGLEDAVQLAAGFSQTCARRAGGQVVCWGMVGGYLGNGIAGGSTTPVEVVGLGDAVDVASEGSNMCAVRVGGQVVCWGQSSTVVSGGGFGLLEPKVIEGASAAERVWVGHNVADTHACVGSAGTGGGEGEGEGEDGEDGEEGEEGWMACWGRNSEGQLGNGTFTLGEVPAGVALPWGE